jgi:NO-binding membrane sensor protein with MHYT domain
MTNAAKRMMDAASTEALFAAAHAAMPTEARKAVLLAAVRRLHYTASIAQGFTPDEALILCKDAVQIK